MIPSEIKVGMRVTVATPPDKDCDRWIVWGHGKVTFTEAAGRTEVHFDSGSGGMWPHRFIYHEPKTWEDVRYWLLFIGWEVEDKPLLGLPPVVWQTPDGLSGRDFRHGYDEFIADAVIREAYRRGDIGFIHLAPLFTEAVQ